MVYVSIYTKITQYSLYRVQSSYLIMTICNEVDTLYKHGGQENANTLLKLLQTQDSLLEVNVQRDGEGLYLLFKSQRNDGHYFNFGEIAGQLYNKYGLCIQAFDQNSNGTRTVWLVTRKYMENK